MALVAVKGLIFFYPKAIIIQNKHIPHPSTQPHTHTIFLMWGTCVCVGAASKRGGDGGGVEGGGYNMEVG